MDTTPAIIAISGVALVYLDITAIFDSSRTQHVWRQGRAANQSYGKIQNIAIFGRFVKGSLAAVYLATASKIAGLL